jgi:DnaJ-domain-containing protein 1
MLSALRHVRVDPNASKPEPKAATSHAGDSQQSGPESAKEEDPATIPASDAELKRLYRKIVHETHPDKVSSAGYGEKEAERRTHLYKLATEASNKQNEDVLVEVALDLEIDTGLDEERIAKSLKNRSLYFSSEISQIKASVEWFWVNAPEEEKVKIIKEICNRNGWIYVTDADIVECVRFATGVHPGSREEVMRKAREINQKRRALS